MRDTLHASCLRCHRVHLVVEPDERYQGLMKPYLSELWRSMCKDEVEEALVELLHDQLKDSDEYKDWMCMCLHGATREELSANRSTQ